MRLATLGVIYAVGIAGCLPAEKPDALPTKSSSKEPIPLWANAAKEAAVIGNVKVRVTNVAYENVKLEALLPASSKQKALVIGLEISNLTDEKKLSYHLWGRRAVESPHKATLRDEFDNRYLPIMFGLLARIADQQQQPTSLYPGKPLSDVLVFEEPVAKAKTLKLELPGSALDQPSDTFRFQIPIEMVRGREELTPPNK